MKNQNTGVNILYSELSVRIYDPIQNSAPRIPLVFDFYLPDTCSITSTVDQAAIVGIVAGFLMNRRLFELGPPLRNLYPKRQISFSFHQSCE